MLTSLERDFGLSYAHDAMYHMMGYYLSLNDNDFNEAMYCGNTFSGTRLKRSEMSSLCYWFLLLAISRSMGDTSLGNDVLYMQEKG